MDTVKLKSKRGVVSFRQRVISTHKDSGKKFYEMHNFVFNFDNDFKCDVPVQVWEDVKNKQFSEEFLYKDIFQQL